MSKVKVIPLLPTHFDDATTVHRLAKIEAERGIIRDSDLALYTPEFFHKRWDGWLENPELGKLGAEVDGKIVGFVLYGKIFTRPDFDKGVVPRFGGEIYAIYIHPDYFRQGIGKALFKAACAELSDQKLTSMVLWALKKNKRACAFYESMGGERIAKQRVDIGESSWAEESCFGWRDVRKVL